LLGLLALAFGAPASAATLTTLVDTDNNAATGCTVATPNGAFGGVERRFVTTVDTALSPPLVTGVTQENCTAAPGTFSAPVVVSSGGWAVGVGNGTGGSNVIETGLPLPASGGTVRIAVVYSDPAIGEDAVTTASGGGPILAAAPQLAAPIEIPTLSDLMLGVLVLLVTAVGWRFGRHRFPAAPMAMVALVMVTTLAWAAIVLDGLTGDWAGIAPVATDPADAPVGADISAVFATIEGSTLFVRVDVSTGMRPAAVADNYPALSGTPLNIAAPSGLLVNDTRGVPAANLTRFGGGSLGGVVTDNAAGATASFGTGGSLTVNGDGSFVFTPASGFSGNFTFSYRIGNVNATSDALVTIAVQQAPAFTSANATAFVVGAAGTFTVTASGVPAPTLALTSGTLPAGVTFNAATGVLSGTPGPGTLGTYPLTFTATNASGSVSQSFTLTVGQGVVITSANAAAFAIGVAGTFTVTTVSAPVATTITLTGALPAGVTFVNNGNGTATIAGTPGPGTAGTYPLTIQASNGTPPDASQSFTLTVTQAPIPGADSYQAVGNTLLEVASVGVASGPKILFTSSNLLSNDTNGMGGAPGVGVTVVGGTFATPNGSITLATNGTFTYMPNAGFTGADTFSYTVSNGLATSTGSVTITVVAHRVWYVKNDAPPGGDGRSSTPFNTLAAAVAASAANDTIFLFAGDGTTTGQNAGAVLKNGQRLVGEGTALDVPVTVNSVVNPVLLAAGATPLIGNTGGNGVTLALDNTLKGFNIGNASGTAIFGASVGTLAVATVSINTTGAGLDLTGVAQPAVNVVLGSLVSSGGAKNVNLVGLGGTVDLGGGALSGATGNAFDVSAPGAANITFGGTIANSSTNARVVSVDGKNGGSVSLSGAIASAGANPAGIVLTNNGGATIGFSGPLSLSTGTNAAFTATGGGTVSATGAGSTLAATTATALNLANTTIAAGGLHFVSVASNGGTASGIIVDNTGTSGSLVVSGSGAPGTGGTIANKAGTDGQTASGIGIYLNNTKGPSFSWMQLNDFGNYAIRGFVVDGFTLDRTVINGTNGTTDVVAAVSSPEGSVAFGAGTGEFGGPANGLVGSASITNTSVSGGFADNFRVFNQSGTLDRLTFDAVAIGANSTANGNAGILIEPQGTAVIKATVTNSTFTASRGDLLHYVDNGSGAGQDLLITNNAFSNNHPAIATGGGGVTISSGVNNNLPVTITGNTFRDAVGPGVLIVKTLGTGTLSGTFGNNTIGVLGFANSGSAEGSAFKLQTVGQGTVTLAITNNLIHQYNNFGIELLAGGGAVAQSGAFNATITGNTVDQPGNTAGTIAIPKNGIHLNIGTVPGDTFQACAVITSNSIATSGLDSVPATLGDIDFRLRQRQATTIRLPGYGGANNDNAAVTTFVANNNGGTPVGLVTNTVPTGGGYIGTGATCP